METQIKEEAIKQCDIAVKRQNLPLMYTQAETIAATALTTGDSLNYRK